MDLRISLWQALGSALRAFAKKKLYVLCTWKFVLAAFLIVPPEVPHPAPGQSFRTSFMRFRSARAAEGSGPPTSAHDENFATWTPIENIAGELVCAVVKAEDRMFFRHHGFDWGGILRAALLRLRVGSLMGASTISQQLARNLFLTPERSWSRKALEAWYTIRLEELLSKREILELYLNSIEWGDGIWGAERAARHFFGVSSADLTLEQSIFLASRIANPEAAPADRELQRMEEVYGRVNWQLRISGFYPVTRSQRVRAAWQGYSEALARNVPEREALAAFSADNYEHLIDIAEALRGECGLALELGGG